MRHVLQGMALGLGTAGLASAAYQGYGMALDRHRYPPPGDLVDVGGRRIHLLKAPGSGLPLVIVAALSTPAIDWLAIQRMLAPEVPVILYDRGGLGWSDPGRGPRTLDQMADELHALLANAGIEPPYALAGHSLGGLVALVYTVRHREHVAGLALIDSSHPDMHRRLPAREWFTMGRGAWLSAALWEVHIGRSCDQARPCLTDLGTLPLTVVTSSEHDPSRTPGSPADRRRSRWYVTLWSLLQVEFASLSRDSSHIIAERAGHQIHRDDPELVVSILRDLVSRACQPRKRT